MPNAPSESDFADLQAHNAHLKEQVDSLSKQLATLQQKLDWFHRQLFGQKSEKRHEMDLPGQTNLPFSTETAPPPPEPEKEKIEYTRRKKSRDNCVTEHGLRFDESVPIRRIVVASPEIDNLEPDQYTVISVKKTHRLAQRPASYEVIIIETLTVKLHDSGKVVSVPPPENVLERSFADVSFLAGMLVDKFQFHLPLYRQHQRLRQAGIQVSRQSLTGQSQRAIELLRPIYDAQLQSVLQSKVLALDETPIKAGQDPGKHALKHAYFWPMYGDRDEMVFPFTAKKNFDTLKRLLGDWQGTMVSDGAAVYDKASAATLEIVHANCWAHTRRKFDEAKTANPKEAEQALTLIAELYRHERVIRDRKLTGKRKRDYRLKHSAVLVKRFRHWCEDQLIRPWTSADPIGRALNYVLNRGASLEVFLTDPAVPIDTNHLEAGLRPIPMGRRNWLFCWTELGAEHVGIVQSLLTTCRLQGVHPYTYLVDVLQRVGEHPADRVHELTPRLWREHFADNPKRSLLDLK